jgi:hypothetical protein
MSYGLGIGIAGLPLLGIAGPSLRQGAAGTSYFERGGAIIWDDWHKDACGALSIMTTQNQIEIFAAVSAALSAELKELNAQCKKARSAETAHLRNKASH